MRELTDVERMILTAMADKVGPTTRRQLLADIAAATAENCDPEGRRVLFHIHGYTPPPYVGQRSYGVEGRVRDADGEDLTVALYADHNGRLYELELIRYGSGSIQGPEWSTLQLY